MDKKQFLASGLIEQYVLGLTDEEETRLVEHFVENYPDIRAKLTSLQSEVEDYASQYAVLPPHRLKDRILSEIQAEDSPPPARRPSRTKVQKPRVLYMSLLGTLLVALAAITVLLWRQQQLQENYNTLSSTFNDYRSRYDNLQRERTLAETIFSYIESGDAEVVHLRGEGVARDVHAVVYWNTKDQKAHVKLVKMPALPSGKQFQIWADINGQMVNAGLLDNGRTDLQKMQYIPHADSLNITIEPLGGSPEPSVLLLVAKGSI